MKFTTPTIILTRCLFNDYGGITRLCIEEEDDRHIVTQVNAFEQRVGFNMDNLNIMLRDAEIKYELTHNL